LAIYSITAFLFSSSLFNCLYVFVGGLDPNVSEDDLRQTFSQYGEISSVKIPVGKQCGFVQFLQRYVLLALHIFQVFSTYIFVWLNCLVTMMKSNQLMLLTFFPFVERMQKRRCKG
jgi:RNA recognition motif-containing protein